MKKVVYLIVGLLALFSGVAFFYLRIAYLPISLSQLRQNEWRLESREFRVVGKLEVTREEGRYWVALKDWENDDCVDNFCFYALDLSAETEEANIALIGEIADNNRTRWESSLPPGEYLADVEVTGQLIEKKNEMFGGEKYNEIKVEKIKQRSTAQLVLLDPITHGFPKPSVGPMNRGSDLVPF